MSQSSEASSTVFESLILKERDLFAQLEEKAKKIFMLDSKGCVIFKVPRELLSIRQLVMVYLLAQTIGFERKVKDSRTLKGEDLAKLTGTPAYAIAAINTLRDHCFVELEPVTEMPESTDEVDDEGTGDTVDEVDNEENGATSQKDEEPVEVYRVSLSMTNFVLDDILATVAAWERKHFYPFTWQERQHNAPYLPQNSG